MKVNNHLGTFFCSTVNDSEAFMVGLQKAIHALNPIGIYSGDNLFTFGRNLGFMNDKAFVEACERNTFTEVEKCLMWRAHTLCWAAHSCLKKAGDFVECGTYEGFSMRVVCEYLDFGSVDKTLYLYDLFEHREDMAHHAMPKHGPDLYDKVVARFSDLGNVQVTKGLVPDSFSIAVPEKIAFLHIDMNSAEAEIAALEHLFERVVDGGIIVFDDYGWFAYQEQQAAENKFMEKYGYKILEMPTGQGLLIK